MPGDLWAAPDIVPSIKYRDLAGAIDWLTRGAGVPRATRVAFVLAGRWNDMDRSRECPFHISTPDPARNQAAGLDQGSFVMKVYVDDVDAHFAHAKAQGAEILTEPEDGFWGGRIYRVRDPRGINLKYRSAVGISRRRNGRFRPESLEDELIQEIPNKSIKRNLAIGSSPAPRLPSGPLARFEAR